MSQMSATKSSALSGNAADQNNCYGLGT